MSELLFSTVFREVSRMFRGEAFSTMYFGRHCGKNLLILKHDLTAMVVFEDNHKWSEPELIKAVSFRGERRKGIKIVGNGDIILLLDECGHLWKLVNAFEVTDEENASLHSLREDCFYEWIPFKKFKFGKVLALTATKHGFACLGVGGNSKKKLVVLSSSDSHLEDLTFEELNASSSLNYYLTNIESLRIFSEEETLLITDRFSGKTYLCGKHGRISVINVSHHYLISAVHFPQQQCLLLSFESGKLIFYFYNNVTKQCDLYLSRKIVFLQKCCCPHTCLLWSDGIILRHTKVRFDCDENCVKVFDLKLNCSLQSPVSLLRIHQQILIVTVNNFYYFVKPGLECSEEIKKHPKKILSEITKGSNLVGKLEKETDQLTHYLFWKDIIGKNKVKRKLQINWEGNNFVLKSSLEISFEEEIWKLRLSASKLAKSFVRLIDFENHLSKGMSLTVENPFKTKVKLSLVGNFKEENLFISLGEFGEFQVDFEKKELIEILENILRKRNEFYLKGS